MSVPAKNRLPIRIRLVAGFAAGMLVVLTGAAGFVYWRVRYALDLRLDNDLDAQSFELVRALAAAPDAVAALAAGQGPGRLDQVLDVTGRVLVADPMQAALLSAEQTRRAAAGVVLSSRGSITSGRGRHLLVKAVPARTGGGSPVVAVTAVRLDQRDEALRELLAQLAIANLLALLVASAVGYRLATAALAPVEAYRRSAAEITSGATGVRLRVPDGPDDEVRRLGVTLNEMLAAQELAADRQRQFIDDASHELRTPLTLLAGEVELALRRPRPAAELREALVRVGEDATRLTELAQDLLTLGAQGARPAQSVPVAVQDLLDSAAARAAAQRSGASVCLEAGAARYVTGDAAALARALANLVDNAGRHGAAPVTLTASPAGDGLVALTVHDVGAGIPADFLARATDRFTQAAPSRGQGSGLGLALVEAIVTAHDGELRVCAQGLHHVVAPGHRSPEACRHPVAGTAVTMVLPAS